MKNVLAMLLVATALVAFVGCASDQAADSGVRSRFPQTNQSIVVDASRPPKEGAKVVQTYEDVAFGKTELRDDDYHRHADPASATGWTPWHHRNYPHAWGSAPAAAPVAKKTPPVSGAQYFPSGYRDSSLLMIERMAPAEVGVGEEFEYWIKATNYSDLALHNTVITDVCGPTLQVISSDPAVASNQGGVLTWNLGTLDPGASKTIKVKAKATQVGSIQKCIAASFDPRTCIAINVVEPKLELMAEITPEVIQCDPIVAKYTVKNTGSGAARNVMVKHTLPAGLMTADGKSVVEQTIPVLQAGQSQTMSVNLKAGNTGKLDSSVSAKADGGLDAGSKALSTMVRKPVLAIENTCVNKVFLGKGFSHDITVTNTGDGDARDAVVTIAASGPAKVVKMTEGGSVAGATITYNLGTLKAKESKKFSVSVEPTAMGQVKTDASARAYCAETVAKACTTDVMGIPAILLEVVDVSDPIRVGEEETYTITVTNQGSATDTNIGIVVGLENTMQFVSAGGATAGTHANGTITFAKLPSLAPKAVAVWTVKVKAVKAGDVRLKTTMTSDQLTRPVEETEATNFYE